MKKQVYNLGLVAILGLGTFVNAQVQEGVVGINTESPDATLDVRTKTGTTKSLRVQNASNVETVTVLNNGNVGIGTDNPSLKLEVSGAIGSSISKDSGPYLELKNPLKTEGGLWRIFNMTDGYTPGLQIWNYAIDATNPLSRMMITDEGKVGIGISGSKKPTAKLDVNGDVRIRTIGEGDANTDKVLLADANGNIKSTKLSNLSSGNKLQNLTGGIRKVEQANATEWAKEGTFCLIQTTTATIDMPDPAEYKDKIFSVNNQAGTKLNYGGSYQPKSATTLQGGKGHILMSDGANWYVIGGSY